ncbi:MAG: sulfatase-like hydrolase/transferase, partial [Planctomycetaceae bacterium]|nr:sulfatase-like hydrolase/transferase [Planctomycetaceae bacterium]
TPLCSPVRACLLTGLHTHHHGILDNNNRSEKSHELKTFPQTLQQNGYQTGYVAKWHMGNDDPARHGFDYWVSMKGQGTSFDPTLNINGKQRKFNGHTTDVLNQKSVEFVRQKREKPFCLYIAHKALHPELTQFDDGSITDPKAAKFIPAKRHRNLYSNSAIPWRLNVLESVDDKPALNRKIKGVPPLSWETATSEETIRDRLRMLAGIDEGLGLLLNELERSGQLDETVIVFTSDHGYWYGEHGLSVERRLPYEEGIRIPLFIRYPKLIKPGRLIDEVALSIDLAPTLLDLAKVKPTDPVDGRSLVPLLSGQTPADWRSSFLIQYNTDTVFPRVLNMGYRAIRTPRWKYIRYQKLQDMDELYDLLNDPFEMTNAIDQTQHAEVLKELKTELDKLIQQEPAIPKFQ